MLSVLDISWSCEKYFLLHSHFLLSSCWIFNPSLQIDGEKLFVDITGMLKTAIDWEERASNALACEAQMFDFEDLMRFLRFQVWFTWSC